MQRIYFIDNLRVACMLLGVFVHASHLGDFGIFNRIPDISAMFRMSTFFMVSGFFGAMLLTRQSVPVFLSGRMRNLAIPLLSGVLLLNPLNLWLIFRHFNAAQYPDFGWNEVYQAVLGRIPADGPMIWHLHLWFLFSLIVCVLAATLLLPVLRNLAKWVDENRPLGAAGSGTVVLLLGLGLSFILVVMEVLEIAMRHAGISFWLISATLDALSYYTIGMMLFLTPFLWQAVQKISIPMIGTALVFVVVVRMKLLPDVLQYRLETFENGLVHCAIGFTLIALFSRFMNRTSPFLHHMSRSIYTIYLFHYLFIYMIAFVYLAVLPLDTIAFFAISILTIISGYFLHLYVIEKLPFLSLLFNGRGNVKASQAPAGKKA